ncbi:hypothetical protein MTP10_21600 [Nonomuraea sp. 3-1Str]|uniref:hypothetical protein n=1 Tax=Nonomuraea sp. 3-1Str TaxID=2929801 RepID=UPI0028597741|nr:hypothetical protein [Nonomuraea sp. 3-1Str]MDR8411316.1 hypothetical protein [Nonomuraea sp. 3-1Str]
MLSVGAGSLLDISNGPDAIDTAVLPEGHGFWGVAANRSATLACETVAEDTMAAAVSRGRRSFLVINSFSSLPEVRLLVACIHRLPMRSCHPLGSQ